MEKVDEGNMIEDDDDDGDSSDIEDSGDNEADDDVNPLLVEPDGETEERMKTKLWFSKGRVRQIGLVI